jgi:hypothetical protein
VSIGTGPGTAEPDPAPEKPRRASTKWKLTLFGLIGVYVLLAAYGLVANAGGIKGTFAAASTSAKAPSPTPGTTLSSASPSASRAKPTRPAAVPRTSSAAAHSLGVSSITAFGPEGPADGDNPRIASRLLTLGADQPWYSQWYTTPSFGGLRTGTGLLLDLGTAATVTDVRLTLGSKQGADVQVYVGSTPSLDLPAVASAWGTGGTVRLTAATAAEGRYVLIWFTRLPPDGRGHYQVSVYNVAVDGVSR